jgi:hypothetical protein
MSSKVVDVFGMAGERLATYTVTLDDVDCLDAEFEEVALILAEASGVVKGEELLTIVARCAEPAIPERRAVEQSARPKGKVISLVKRRMELARGAQHRSGAKYHAS